MFGGIVDPASVNDATLEKLLQDPNQMHRLFNDPNVKSLVPNFANQIADLPVDLFTSIGSGMGLSACRPASTVISLGRPAGSPILMRMSTGVGQPSCAWGRSKAHTVEQLVVGMALRLDRERG